jgi:hypothetical protein
MIRRDPGGSATPPTVGMRGAAAEEGRRTPTRPCAAEVRGGQVPSSGAENGPELPARRYTIAIGRPGEPVAPLARMGANTYTHS